MKKLFSVAAIFGLSGCSSFSHYYSPSIEVEKYQTPEEMLSAELPEPFTFELDETFNVKYSGHVQRHNHLTDAVYELCSRNGGAYRRDSLHYDTVMPDNLPKRTGIYSCYTGTKYLERSWSVEVFNDGPRQINDKGYESTLHINLLDEDSYKERLAYHEEAAKSIHSVSLFQKELFKQAALKRKAKGDQVCSYTNEYGDVLSVNGDELNVDIQGQLVADVPGEAISSPSSIKLAIENRREKVVKASDWAVCFVDPDKTVDTENN